VIQDFDKNKLEKSQAVANNLPYILREMWGEKEVWKTTSSIQHGSLNDKGTATIQSKSMNAYQSESPFKEYTGTYCSLDTLYAIHPIL
jgi:hypothetical protein